MDLLRQMAQNRQEAGITQVITKTKVSDEPAPGTRTMREYIIAKKPGKKVVKTHFLAIIQRETETSSDED